VPPEVIYRKKWGFGIPVGHWFRTRWRRPLRRLLLSDQALDRGLFQRATVARVLDEHACGQVNHHHRIWTLLVFELWNRLVIDRTLQPGEPVLQEA
jgi:asparagine synthase (glutamine-hydrolysing)